MTPRQFEQLNQHAEAVCAMKAQVDFMMLHEENRDAPTGVLGRLAYRLQRLEDDLDCARKFYADKIEQAPTQPHDLQRHRRQSE